MTFDDKALSFELFPPRNDAAALALGRTIDKLCELSPSFVSVTFGAGGKTRTPSLTVLSHILNHTNTEPMAHLTCVGSTHAEISELVREFLRAGIRNFLALRGDPPKDAPPAGTDATRNELKSSAELVQLILRVQQELEPFGSVPTWGSPSARQITGRPRLHRLAVAAFPNGQANAPGRDDIEVLRAKQAAGANLAITQLFWHADAYLGYVERARAAGVTIPILPGVMPVVNPARLGRVEELSGVAAPKEFARALREAATEAEAFEVGVNFASLLVREVLQDGAPGIHLYTFNRHDAATAVAERVGVGTRSKHVQGAK